MKTLSLTLSWLPKKRKLTQITTVLVSLMIVAGLTMLALRATADLNVQASADMVISQYLKQQPEIRSYVVHDRLWTRSCCAVSAKSRPVNANGVRYTIYVTLTSGEVREETIDLHDSRDQAEQLNDSRSTWGHQRWKFQRRYVPGDTVPAAIWSV